ncbi:arylsulfatase A family protein [Halovivax asiaticus JCM 14624]|uniref:Arylsulfatase A family protein n=1 Tax=Halovivax asiaticus JCM 14624 TaxID=1227490 RepID=M0BMZ5_9EURY|nr:sulfatase-like hydrolase/transferase [Halovivax asiaticus]ELZ10979.1 arylsulfatase A family protein [Halovivax asiaticus JCM 14624]
MSDSRSVVLVTIDSIRADHCGFGGNDGGLTPNLDELAADGLVFENAVAPAPATHGSATTFLTGEFPVERDGARGSDRASMKAYIREHLAARDTVAQRFSRMGYETAAFTANPWTSRYFGFNDGFDHFEDFMETDASKGFLADGERSNPLSSLVLKAMNWWQGQDMFMSWEAFYDDIVAWTESADEPYFLWVFLVDAHLPYLPPTGYRSRSSLVTYPANLALFADRAGDGLVRPFHGVLTQTYEDTIRYTDEFVGRATAEFGGDPLFVVHGDHGEAFGDHGMYGHGRDLYDELIDVPLVVANGPTGRVERPLPLRNLPELLTSLAREEDYEAALDTYAFSHNRMPKVAVTGETWKYIWQPDGDELYDRSTGETTECDAPELRELGARLVDDWHESHAERERIAAAATRLAAADHL